MKKTLLTLSILLLSIYSFATCLDTIRPVNAYCYTSQYTHLTADSLGGTWSSSNTTIATINSKGMLYALNTGTVTISYTRTLNGCSASKVITINAVPAAILTTGAGTSSTGSVIVNGQSYVKGYLGSNYSVNLNGDSLLQLNYQFGFPSLMIPPATASRYIDGDSLNTPFANMAALQYWMQTHFEKH